MAIEINVPRLGWSMEEGVFGQWLKRPGELVKSGEMLFVLEGDKAEQEIECFDEGYLFIPDSAPQAGQPVKVGQVLGWLLAKDEAPPSGNLTSQTAESAPTAISAEAAVVVRDGGGERSKHKASPRARRRAREMGIDPDSLQGTGAGGRVRERDVIAGSRTGGSPVSLSGKLLPHSAARRLTAERMIASSQQTAPVTLTSTVDATNLANLREQFRSAEPAEPTYTDFIVKLAAMTLENHPLLYAQWREDGLFQPEQINVAFAVDTDWGLIAPVVNQANRLSLRKLAATSRDLAARARERKLALPETQNGVFTVTNLGGLGIDAFTPIVNLPQTAILGVGRIRLMPAVVAGKVIAQQQMTLSLTFDHRVLDGAPAARFLQALGQTIESPAARLID